jgi:hypothetical protein
MEAKEMNDDIAVLDIGCGDICLNEPNVLHADVDKKASHLDVQCDGCHLPFTDNTFKVVYASHVLEHVENPFSLLAEIGRVSFDVAIVKVPNASHYRLFSEAPDHLYGWTSFNLENLLRRHFPSVQVYGSYRITPKGNILMRKLNTIKTYGLSLFVEKNELTAVCHKNPPNVKIRCNHVWKGMLERHTF